MTWTPYESCGHESAKIAAHTVHYLQGNRVLDLGCGDSPVFPGVIGIDSHATFRDSRGIKGDVADLSLFGDGTIDAIFSSHVLEDFERSKVPAALKEWWRVLKTGGNLVLYLPHKDHYPHIGEDGCNPAHNWEPTPEAIIEIMKGVGSWTMLENETRTGTNEYSFFQVFRKDAAETPTHNFELWQRHPDGKKRCLVIRYGAIGDALQTSSIFPMLKLQGYHVTVNCKPSTKAVLQHDPNIDAWMLQDTDFVPNSELGPYWASLTERYDHIVNLCESIEGGLLTMPGRMTHGYPVEVRRKLFGGVSYLTRTHDIANVPHVFNPRFYPSDYEERWAKALRKAYTNNEVPIITWALAGSGLHKIYPHVETVLKWLLQRTPAHVVLTGDKGVGKDLQEAVLSHFPSESRIHPMAGKWSIRETLAFAKFSDVVVGPETGVLNCVSFEPGVAKVLLLSHSSKQNIGGDWPNTVCLEPDRAKAPCFPCHRLHGPDWTFCHQSEKTAAALCATEITPEQVFHAIMTSLGAIRNQ